MLKLIFYKNSKFQIFLLFYILVHAGLSPLSQLTKRAEVSLSSFHGFTDFNGQNNYQFSYRTLQHAQRTRETPARAICGLLKQTVSQTCILQSTQLMLTAIILLLEGGCVSPQAGLEAGMALIARMCSPQSYSFIRL